MKGNMRKMHLHIMPVIPELKTARKTYTQSPGTTQTMTLIFMTTDLH